MRFLRLLIWDALYCIVPTVGYAATSVLGSSGGGAVVTLLMCAFCGAFLAQLSRWGTSWMNVIVVTIPGLYLALAPYLAPLLNGLPLSFDLVPAFLLTSKAVMLRQAGALAAGFTLWQHVFISIPHRR
ncbi:MAG: hypothetical protein Q4P20_07455 [Eubacteriales bacterium]|nr:hypothetical protein [Eubacteriales bacterium]